MSAKPILCLKSHSKCFVWLLLDKCYIAFYSHIASCIKALTFLSLKGKLVNLVKFHFRETVNQNLSLQQ